ncbi:MAG: nucleotidyltransferase domain-containing protein [Actinomycetota bacterium]|nr:nucleotidyltransferase domain-containing protein [Actinomycetota bacterium]
MVPKLVDAFLEWAKPRADVVGVALVGSHARGSATAGSDIDLLLVTTDPAAYVSHTRWTRELGAVGSISTEEWGAVTSVRVSYVDGPEVEFGVTSPAWTTVDPVDPGTARVVRGGFRILFDPTGSLELLAEAVNRS